MSEVTIGLYRHFKGGYYYVTGLSRSAEDEKTVMVNYFDVCHPEYGSFVRPLYDFTSCTYMVTLPNKDVQQKNICERPDNVTGQFRRFERVKDLNFQLGSVSTEQLIDELRKRTDSPIHELDIEGLYSPVFSNDYVVGVPYNNPEYSRGVDTIAVYDTLEQAEKFVATHNTRRDTGIYKRTFIRIR